MASPITIAFAFFWSVAYLSASATNLCRTSMRTAQRRCGLTARSAFWAERARGLSFALGRFMDDALLTQERLRALNHARLTPRYSPADSDLNALEEHDALVSESRFLEDERRAISARAAKAPSDPAGFLQWFEELEVSGPGQGDPLFLALQHQVSRPQMIWFLRQEIAGEAGFDDLVALTQVGMPPRAKLELARNYWDEMGRGHAAGMHGQMLQTLAQHLQESAGREPAIPYGSPSNAIVWESLALANLMTGLAANRTYAFHSIGSLGAVELTAPGRAKCVSEGMKRLGYGGEARKYYALHATLDLQHSAAWNREVIFPLVEEDGACARAIAEGALMRLRAGARCFERYRRELGIHGGPPSPYSAGSHSFH